MAVLVAGSTAFAVDASGEGSTSSASSKGAPLIDVTSSTTPFTLVSPVNGGDSGWQNVGAPVVVRVPSAWSSGLMLLDFSAMATCDDEPACSLRILVDGQEPNPTGDPTFWSPPLQASWPLDLNRWVTAAPGSHTVQIQADAGTESQTGGAQLMLQNWMLTVEMTKSKATG